MKDAAHHLKRIQRKVIQEIRKSQYGTKSTNHNGNGTNGYESHSTLIRKASVQGLSSS